MKILLLLVLTLVALMPTARVGRASGSTCSMVPIPDPRDRLELAADFAELVLIGYVTQEEPVRVVGGVGRPTQFQPIADGESKDGYGLYQSKVRIEATLKGQDPGPEITLNILSDDWQCAGGPRIPEGTRVLLMLRLGPFETGPSAAPPEWQSGPTGSPTVLTESGAFLMDYQSVDMGWGDVPRKRPQYVGTSPELVKWIALEVGATEQATEQALAAVEAPQNGPLLKWLFIIGGLFGSIGLAMALAARRAR